MEGRIIRSSFLHIQKQEPKPLSVRQNMCLLPCGKNVVPLQKKLSEASSAQFHQWDGNNRSDNNTTDKGEKTKEETIHLRTDKIANINASCEIGYKQDND